MARKQITIDKPQLILGEGQDEENFFTALLKHMEIDNIQAMQYGGKHQLTQGLATITQSPNFYQVTSFGITRDADYMDASDEVVIQAAFDSICTALSRVSLGTPSKLMEKTILDGKPDTTIFILPDCNQKGMLENLYLQSLAGISEIECIVVVDFML